MSTSLLTTICLITPPSIFLLDERVFMTLGILKLAAETSWGGRTGYFADPDGFAWEVAWNPGFAILPDGAVAGGISNDQVIARTGEPHGRVRHRLALGIADSSDLPPDQVFPLDAGFEELNGVSFHDDR